MKRFVKMLLVLTAMLSLTTVAHADVITGPALLLYAGVRLLPYLLVFAVVVVTIILLRKFRKKK